MDLFIKSQDRTKLVKFNAQIYYVERDCGETEIPVQQQYDHWDTEIQKVTKYEIYCDDEIFLGEYKSKQRALDVIDKIRWHIAHIYKQRSHRYRGWAEDDTLGAYDEVFQMPD